MALVAVRGFRRSLGTGKSLSFVRPESTMRTIRQYIPTIFKRATRAVYYLSIDTYRSITKTRKPMTPPAMTSFLVGAGDFHAIGSGIRDSLVQETSLNKSSIVLEIGCGYGRVAAALTKLIIAPGRYDGIDIVERATQWCTEEISSQYSNFRFFHADVSNPYANDGKGQRASTFKLPFQDNTYDVVFLTSVFSHMRPTEIRAYLKEISRVLKAGGKCYATYYLVDDFARNQIYSRNASQDFKYDFGDFLSTHKRIPEQTIAVPELLIIGFYEEANLLIQEPIQYGSWTNRLQHHGYQDLIVATKP
ncbi:MAG: class I SAM-dependent methyltransferase [Burkholderiales bacterium]